MFALELELGLGSWLAYAYAGARVGVRGRLLGGALARHR